MNKHGFEVEGDTPDYMLMAVDEHVVAKAMNTMIYAEYMKYKLECMKEALRKRTMCTTHSGEHNARINFTRKAIALTKSKIKSASYADIKSFTKNEQIIVPVTEFDIEEFKSLVNREPGYQTIEWTFVSNNGSIVEIIFTTESEEAHG